MTPTPYEYTQSHTQICGDSWKPCNIEKMSCSYLGRQVAAKRTDEGYACKCYLKGEMEAG